MEKLPVGITVDLYLKDTEFEKNRGYIITIEKMELLNAKGVLEPNNFDVASDWRHAHREDHVWDKYHGYMYSPSLDILRHQTANEFYNHPDYNK